MYQINIFFFIQTAAATTIGFLIANTIIYLFKIFALQRLNEFFHERGITKTSKRVIHNEINKMCAEGKSSGWQVSPRNSEHWYFVANTAKNWNFDLGSKIDDYLGSWITYVGLEKYAGSPNPFMQNLMQTTLKKIKLLDIAILHQASKEFQGKKKISPKIN